MGYYTYHTVTAMREGEDVTDKALDLLREATGYRDEYMTGAESAKWYDCATDLVDVSKLEPDIEFRVYGEGEGSGDIWVLWAKNGAIQRWSPNIEVPDAPPYSWEELT